MVPFITITVTIQHDPSKPISLLEKKRERERERERDRD
jgi:hypothetical protein